MAEILRHLDGEGGDLQDDAGRWALTSSLVDLGLPQSIREVVTSRAERLGDETASLLSTAAVIGRDFDLELLRRRTEPTRSSTDWTAPSAGRSCRGAIARAVRLPPAR